MKIRIILWLTLLVLIPFVEAAPLRIHIISGAKEYQSEASMKVFSVWMEKNYEVKFSASWGHDGIEKLPNLEALAQADRIVPGLAPTRRGRICSHPKPMTRHPSRTPTRH